MKKRLALKALFLLAWTTVPACTGDGDEAGPGRVKVDWQIDGSTCAKAGIVDVRVDLVQEGVTMLSEVARCSDGGVVMEDVPVGPYEVRVKGFDKDNNPTYEGSVESLSVNEGETPSAPPSAVKLKAKKGTVLLAWTFPATASSICSFNNVETVEVNLSQAGTVVEHFSGAFPCDPAYGDPDQLPAPFENGRIVISDIPPGEVEVVLFGLSPDQERLFFAEENLSVPNSGYVQVLMHFEPCEGKCI